METLTGFIKKIVCALEVEKIDYAFTGALAASYYGVPRTTADIDIIISMSRKDAKAKLAPALRSTGLEVEEKTIDDAYTSGFCIATFKGKTLPYRVDIIFADNLRKRQGNIADIDTWLQVPEDLINAKLRMIIVTLDKGKVAKDESDIKAIIQFTKVDKRLIMEQAKKNKTLQVWERLSTT
jgi:hypothetical protein